MSSVKEKNTLVSPINLTEGAVVQIKRLMEESNIPGDHGLRVGVKGGGCSGFSYVLGFDERKDKDQIFEVKGINILMEKAHGLYLLGHGNRLDGGS